MCVCVRETECVYVCICVCERERECVFIFVREGVRAGVCERECV